MPTPSRSRVYALVGALIAAFFFIGLPFLTWLSGVWIDYL